MIPADGTARPQPAGKISAADSGVPPARSRAAAGGYTAGEQESVRPGHRAATSASLQLKVPVARYPATLALLSGIGRVTARHQLATDVTQQVADVGSRVASARAAISQLRTLLRHAGSVSGLLRVQNQITSQESNLEALLAQQRALSAQTSYATVSMLLLRPHVVPRRKPRKPRPHGFVTGLAAGWHALRAAITWLLAALGAVLPIGLVLAALGGIGYGAWRRIARRRARTTAPSG
jgi:hypothetical protein